MKEDLKPLRPFKLWVLQNFPFIEEDFDALTNYEMMCKIVGKLNEVVSLTNEQTSVINTLNNEFTELYNYVHQYIFDVDELKEAISLINTRLDELAEQVLLNTNNITLLNNKITNEISDLRSEILNIINTDYDTLKNYEPATINDDKKPPIPGVDDAPLILPKIYKYQKKCLFLNIF